MREQCEDNLEIKTGYVYVASTCSQLNYIPMTGTAVAKTPCEVTLTTSMSSLPHICSYSYLMVCSSLIHCDQKSKEWNFAGREKSYEWGDDKKH